MRLYVFSLSFVLITVPIQTYAIAPVAIAGSVAGRVAIQSAGGAVVKKLTGGAISGLAHGAVALCITGQISLPFCQRIKQAMANDGVNYGSSGSGANGSWEVEIYRQSSTEECEIRYLYSGVISECYYNSDMTVKYYSSYITVYNCNAAINVKENEVFSYSNFEVENAEKKDKEFKKYVLDNYEKLLREMKVNQVRSFGFSNDKHYYKNTLYNSKGYSLVYSRYYYQKVCGLDFKNYLTNQEINNYFNKSINDNDITNIYNYDYAQHNNITINNNTLSGDTINNYKNDTEVETQNITNNVVNQIVNNQIDIDDINDRNCTKDTQGRYNNCGANNNNDNPPNDNNSNNDDDNSNSDGSNPSDNNKTCDSNPFFRRVCDWITWTQQDPNLPNGDTVLVKDLSEQLKLDRDRINFAKQCPPPKQVPINVLGLTHNAELSYEPICDFFVKLKPFLVGVSLIFAVLIIGGRHD